MTARRWWVPGASAEKRKVQQLTEENQALYEKLEALSEALGRTEDECERLRAQLNEMLAKMRGEDDE